MKAGFIIILLLYLFGNYYVFYRIWGAMPPHHIGRICLIAFAAIVVSSFFIFFFLGETMPVGLASFFYKIGTSWLIILLYLFIIYLIKDLFALINRFFHFIPQEALMRYTKDNWLALGFVLGFILLLMVSGYLKYQWKVRVALPIQIEKSFGNDSISQKPLRIVAISDLHLGYGIDKDELKGWVDLINKEQPDIVLMAGDIVDNSVRPLNQGNFAEVFKEINAPMGVYACLGNHEYISGVSPSIDFLRKAGINVLRDSVAEIDSCLYIVGRDDRSNHKRKSLESLISNIDKTKPVILLDHQPFHLEEAESCGIDLQLSGHTHKGQVWPISQITKAIYGHDYGYIKKGATNIFISSGIGLWGGKFRIGTQSEYVVIDINKKQ